MKTNRILVLALTCFAITHSTISFAQSSLTKASGAGAPGSKGLVVGLVYSNLSDSKSTSEFKSTYNGVKLSDREETFTSGIHAGLMGLHLGYKDIYASGTWGINAGLQVLRGLNGSETPSKLNIYKVLGDVVLPLTDHLALSAGLNVSYFDGYADNDFKVYPGLGAQVGAEVRMNQVALLVGAQLLSIRADYTATDYDGGVYKAEGKTNSLYSGVITQLSYTF
jgi:hypothetical protein